MAETTINPNAELMELAECPTTPRWLQELIPTLLDKDPVDVLGAVEQLQEHLERRLDTLLKVAQEHVTITVLDEDPDNPQGGWAHGRDG